MLLEAEWAFDQAVVELVIMIPKPNSWLSLPKCALIVGRPLSECVICLIVF